LLHRDKIAPKDGKKQADLPSQEKIPGVRGFLLTIMPLSSYKLSFEAKNEKTSCGIRYTKKGEENGKKRTI
jgi:hypothetical protein